MPYHVPWHSTEMQVLNFWIWLKRWGLDYKNKGLEVYLPFFFSFSFFFFFDKLCTKNTTLLTAFLAIILIWKKQKEPLEKWKQSNEYLSTLFFSGTSYLLWTQKLFLLHAIMSVSSFCHDASVIMCSPSTSPDRASSPMVVMPYSTPAESVINWLPIWSKSYDNDDRQKWQKLQGNF